MPDRVAVVVTRTESSALASAMAFFICTYGDAVVALAGVLPIRHREAAKRMVVNGFDFIEISSCTNVARVARI